MWWLYPLSCSSRFETKNNVELLYCCWCCCCWARMKGKKSGVVRNRYETKGFGQGNGTGGTKITKIFPGCYRSFVWLFFFLICCNRLRRVIFCSSLIQLRYRGMVWGGLQSISKICKRYDWWNRNTWANKGLLWDLFRAIIVCKNVCFLNVK